jgi:hypothetical protein
MCTGEIGSLAILMACREFIFCSMPLGVMRPFGEKSKIRNYTNYWVMTTRIDGKPRCQQQELQERDVHSEVLNRMKTVMDKLFVGCLSPCRALADQ